MAKYIYGAVACVLIVAAVGFFLRSEGERTRETIRQAASTQIRNEVADSTEKVMDKAAELPGRILRDVKDGVAEAAELARSARPGGQPAETNVPDQSTTSHETPEASTSSPIATAVELAKTAGSDVHNEPGQRKRKSRGLFGGLFDAAHQAAKTVDNIGQEVLELDLEQERELGRQLHEFVVENHETLKDESLVQKLERLAKPLYKYCTRRDIRYTFTILESPEVNVFSHAGGYIYFCKGAIDLVETDEQLQFVLAHEIAHVDLKHCIRGLTYAARAGQLAGGVSGIGGQLVNAAYQMIALGYSEEQEFAADEWAFRKQRQLGVNAEQSVSFFRRLLVHEREEKKVEGPRPERPTVAGGIAKEIENHFRSHPPTEERIRRLEQLSAQQ